jgi:hypothetical protein
VITAETSGTVTTVAAGAQGADKFALGGSIAVTATNTQTKVNTLATIGTPGSVKVAATSSLKFVTAAGNVDIAVSGVAVGVASATLLRKDQTQASVGYGSIDFNGSNTPVDDVATVSAGQLQSTDGYVGLSITAVSTDDVTTAAAGGAVSGEAVSAAGSATFTKLDKSTLAQMQNNEKLPNAQGNTSINMVAYDESKVGSGAGGLAASSTVGVGAGVDVVEITKDTLALFELGQDMNLASNLIVQSLSKEDLVSVAVGLGLSAGTGIGGAASAYVLDLSTESVIGYGSTTTTTLTAGGSVQVAAQDDTVINQFPGGAGIAPTAGIGGSAGVIDVKQKLVNAAVESGMTIIAEANSDRAPVQGATGEFEVGFNPPSGQTGDVPPPNISVDTGKQTGNSTTPPLTNSNLTQERKADPVFEAVHGIAVSAINTGVIKAMNYSAGLSQFALALDAGVDIVNMTTQVQIQPDVSLQSSGDVILASGADLQKLGVTGALSGGTGASGVAGADVTLVGMNTSTTIGGSGDAVTITAGDTGSVIVNAQAQEDILAISVGFGLSVSASLDATAAVVKIDNSTFAGTTDGASATISAGGNVLIDAADDTTVAGIAGGAAVGMEAGALGGSAVVTLIDKITNAAASSGTAIDAHAYGNDQITVPDGTGVDGKVNTKTIQGVSIQATSSENVAAVAVGGAVGTYLGGAAGATVTIIDSDTSATSAGLINQGGGVSDFDQSVSIAAANNVKTFTIGGGLGLGAVGLGGGVDYGVIRNGTTAAVTGGRVSGAQEIDVVAPTLIDIDSYAIGAGGGAVGVGGSISLWTIGGPVGSTYSNPESGDDALKTNHNNANPPPPSFQQSVDTQTTRGDVTMLLSGYGNVGGANGTQIGQATGATASDLSASQPNGRVEAASGNTPGGDSNAVVATGAEIQNGTLNVLASETLTTSQIPGSGSIGLGAVGASVAILNRGEAITASMDGTYSGSGGVNVEASQIAAPYSWAIGGTLGLAALGAEVTVVNDNSSVAASVGPVASIDTAGNLSLQANTQNSPTLQALSVDGSVFLTVGATIGAASITGSTAATLGGLINVNEAVVNATATLEPTINTKAADGGILISTAGNYSALDLAPTIAAEVTSGTLTAEGGVDVIASGTVDGQAIGQGTSLFGTVSASYSGALAELTSNVAAVVGSGSRLTVGSLTVEASATEAMTADATANAGYTLLGADEGAVSNAMITNRTTASVLGSVDASGDIEVLASHPTSEATAYAIGIVGQGLVDVGISKANASSTSNVQAYIDSPDVFASGDVTVGAYEGADDGTSTTGPVSLANSSQGVYAGGSDITAETTTTSDANVSAFIGDPSGPDTNNGSLVHADGDLEVTANSATSAYPRSLNGSNDSFISYGDAVAEVSYLGTTQAYLGAGTQASAGGTASILASNIVAAGPEAYGLAGGDGGAGTPGATGAASTLVTIARETLVTVGQGASLEANVIDLDAESSVTGQGTLSDNQNNGGYNAAYHASGWYAEAKPVATFNIGADRLGNSTQGLTSVEVKGALAAPTINMTAHTMYDFSVHGFAWVTGGVASELESTANVTTNDSANVILDAGSSLTASDQVTINANFADSTISMYNRLHYSELVASKQNTYATATLNGSATIQNLGADIANAPNIDANVDKAVTVDQTWDYTTGSGNDQSSDGTHDENNYDNLTASNSFDPANPAASVATRIDPSTGWIIQGVDEEEDWLELSGDPAAIPIPPQARIALRP